MSIPLRVLILEDRPADAELLVHELRQAGFDPDWECVESEPDYLAQLDPALDVILADYTLPQFDALRALHLLKVRELDIPFIVVTGSISEEAAVECMRQGAADYLLKDRLVRLGQAVSHALAQKRLRDEKRQTDERIKASLKEKEMLLKEVHHRVKNNLQVIVSLLNLQAEYVRDAQALEMFRESRDRVKSMALVHEKLYHSKNLAKIDFADYVRDLAVHLLRLYRGSADGITLKVNVEDVFLGIDKAIPCGLIISELVSNSLKHARLSGQQGEIGIELRSDKDSKYVLTVRDNGVGFPKWIDFRNTRSLGLRLVTTLTNQLDGSIELANTCGTAFQITFAELKR